ncbi:fungal transcriptional regulatory [Fusarium denticulatum]|uniref:Fungal transcriptional regulatory n=1 Tax=Fusarium denticulatum TaxID=48507 RepID=A0A8H5UC36_9HYPO|nr:fungal transcriptional regulatory [Fusarium denticulatum]
MSAVDASRFSVTCTYPELADRRRLVARRESVRAEQTRHFSDAAPVTPESTELHVAAVRSPSVTPRIHSVGHVDVEPLRTELAVSRSAGTNLDDPPPRAIGLALLDIYFERLYNATLLFNRTQLFESYLDGSLPPYLLRSIFALSSLFLRKPRHQPPRLGSHAVSTELAAFATYASYGDAWAESARREAWLLIDRPTVQVVQALSCLNLYWFAIRDLDRARINAVMAYASATTFRSVNLIDNETRTKNELQLIERKYGCFWACWATMCISSFPEAYAKNAWEEACNVPLPIASDGFVSDGNVGHHYHMTVEWKPEGLNNELNPPSSIMAEHMRLMGVWVKIQLINRDKQESPDVTQILHLSSLAKVIYDSSQFPPYVTDNESSGNIARLLGLHSLYHLCQIVLLCPLVSLFSGRRGIAGETTQNHAETIIKHAIHHGHLIRDYITRRQDVSKLNSHVGFASFVSTSIILTLLKSRARRHHDDGNTRDHVSHALVTLIQDSIDILSILQTFWEHLEPMTSSLQRAADLVLGPLDRDRHSITGAESRPIEVPITGVNSPAREEDVIATTYIESPEYPNAQQSVSSYTNAHFGVADRAMEHITQSVDETADWHHDNLFEWCQTEGLLEIGDDFLDIGASVDWNMDLDLLTGFSSQMA